MTSVACLRGRLGLILAALPARLAGREKVDLLALPDLDHNRLWQLPGVAAVLDTGGTVTYTARRCGP